MVVRKNLSGLETGGVGVGRAGASVLLLVVLVVAAEGCRVDAGRAGASGLLFAVLVVAVGTGVVPRGGATEVVGASGVGCNGAWIVGVAGALGVAVVSRPRRALLSSFSTRSACLVMRLGG